MIESLQGNYTVAENLLRQLVAGNKSGEIADYNELAWLSLFRGNGTDDDVSTALRAVSLGQNRNGATLHTLAALYAERGKTAESLQVLFQSMTADSNRGPLSQDWYVLGRIYEQLGELTAARTAYQKVEPPADSPPKAPTSYALAQRRLQAMAQQ